MQNGFLQINGIEALPSFLTSIAIGLLIGLERERNPSAKAGLRTFALVAMFGTLTAFLSNKIGSPWLFVFGLLAVAAMIIAAYHHHPDKDNDPGTTTVIALLLCYGLGAMVWYEQAKLAVMLAIGVTALLYFKPELSGFSQRMARRDLVAALQFCVLTFIILPILPNQDYGPYSAFNPHQAWLMVVLISGISLAGYAALHIIGTRYGAPLLGVLGGLASSTATTLIYAKHSKTNPPMTALAGMVIMVASMVVLVRLMVVSAIVAYGAVPSLLPVFSGGLFCGLFVVVYRWHKMDPSAELYVPETTNPAELHTAVGFGLLYVVVLLGSAWMVDLAGSQGLYIVAFVSGLTDVDAITLSSLRLFNLKQLSEHQTVAAIAIAFIANLIFKFGLVYFIAGRELAKRVATGFAAIAFGVLIALLF
ncbi:MAG: MgtC/SapB family protein [Gallionella sp.]|nr:MgtC/SapB family protein [Gallionella sp.]MDD4958669.1 MgtC/SapB family protein [Gallionella sp.]